MIFGKDSYRLRSQHSQRGAFATRWVCISLSIVLVLIRMCDCDQWNLNKTEGCVAERRIACAQSKDVGFALIAFELFRRSGPLLWPKLLTRQSDNHI